MASNQPIRWKRGEFRTFFAQLKIRVGGKQEVTINEGDEFDYDGSVCRYAGDEFPQPQLRGAIAQGWATVDEEGAVPATFTAPRKVAKSQTKNTDLSRVQRHEPVPMETDALDEDTVLNVADRANVRDDVSGRGHLGARHNRRQAAVMSKGPEQASPEGMQVTQSDIDQQDHTPIARVKSKANLGKIDVTRHPGMARDISRRTHEDGYGKFDGKRRKPDVIHREGVDIQMNVGNVDPSIQPGDEDEGVEVGRVRHSSARKRSAEGISIEDTGRPKAKAKAKKAKDKDKGNGINPKLRIALKVHPDFPRDWNFFGKTDDKMARVKELGAESDLLDALYASESGAMKKALEKKYPKHFAG
jgi:hypothetical protein